MNNEEYLKKIGKKKGAYTYNQEETINIYKPKNEKGELGEFGTHEIYWGQGRQGNTENLPNQLE